MFKCLQIICAKYCELRCTFKKIAPHQSWLVCLMQRQNSRYFRCPIWQTKSWLKSKPTRKLKHANYSRVFWIFLPNVIKIDRYNFELYCFKFGAFFLRHSVEEICQTYVTILLLIVGWQGHTLRQSSKVPIHRLHRSKNPTKPPHQT